MSRWQIYCAVALRRLPETTPKKDPIETKVQEIFYAHENSKSRLSGHEMQMLEDNRLKESPDQDSIITETAQDREDKWNKEKSNFQFAPHDDRLARTKYLFLRSKLGSDIKDQWLLPQTYFDRNLGDRNLIDTARRALSESLNIVNGYKIISKIPSSVCSFKYPKKVVQMTEHDGALIFFLKANLDRPSASVQQAISETDNLKWFTQNEATSVVSRTYMRSLSSGLLSEDRVDVNKVLGVAAKAASQIRSRIEHRTAQSV